MISAAQAYVLRSRKSCLLRTHVSDTKHNLQLLPQLTCRRKDGSVDEQVADTAIHVGCCDVIGPSIYK